MLGPGMRSPKYAVALTENMGEDRGYNDHGQRLYGPRCGFLQEVEDLLQAIALRVLLLVAVVARGPRNPPPGGRQEPRPGAVSKQMTSALLVVLLQLALLRARILRVQ